MPHGILLGYKFEPARNSTENFIKMHQIISEPTLDTPFVHMNKRLVFTDFGLQNIPNKRQKLFLEFVLSFNSGGDPFPGVYMREIPALLKEGYRMACPKFVSPKL